MTSWDLKSHGARTSRKWMSFAAAIWLMACVGTQDTFSLYSPVLKAVLNYDQLQLSTLAGAKETGKGFGLVAGVLSFLVPLWVMLSVAIVESIFGFGFLWLIVTERIASPPYKLMYVVMWIAGNSVTWMNTAAIVVSIQNFPFNRGTVVGVLKGIQALSAAIYVQLGTNLFSNNVESFLLLLAFLPASSCLVGVALLQRVPPVMSRKETHEDRKTFTWVYASTVLLALYILSFNIFAYLTPISSLVSTLSVLLLTFLVAVPVLVPVRSYIVASCLTRTSDLEDGTAAPGDQITDPLLGEEAKESKPLVADSYSNESQWMHEVTQANQSSDISSKKRRAEEPPAVVAAVVVTGIDGNGGGSSSSSLGDIVTAGQDPSPAGSSVVKPKRVLKKLGTHHFTVKDAWGAKEFWLLFFSFFCGIGMSITLQNNLGQVAEALGYKDVAIFLIIFGVSTFFGRILGGGVSEFLIRLAAIPRPFFAAILEAMMVVNYIQLALAFPGALFIGTVTAGLTAGVQMTIAIATASELFGLKFIGMLYNFLLLVHPLAGNLFSGVLVGKLYDYEAKKLGSGSPASAMTILSKWAERHSRFELAEDETCVGAHCFRLIFLIMAGVSAVGVILNLGLLFRVRRLYRSWYWNESLLAKPNDVPPAPLLITHS